MNQQGGKVVLLEKTDARFRRQNPKDSFQIINNDKETDEIEENFYWGAARNCVHFYLHSRRKGANEPKYRSFQIFLSMSVAQARKSNVWRWYFRTGGHPPYDPKKRY